MQLQHRFQYPIHLRNQFQIIPLAFEMGNMDQAIDCTQRLENTLVAWKNLDGSKTFVFSAVSPDDDNIQQKLLLQKAHGSQIKRPGCALRIHAPGKHKNASVVLPVAPIAIRQQWRAFGLAKTSAFVGVLPSVHRERSPPLS